MLARTSVTASSPCTAQLHGRISISFAILILVCETLLVAACSNHGLSEEQSPRTVLSPQEPTASAVFVDTPTSTSEESSGYSLFNATAIVSSSVETMLSAVADSLSATDASDLSRSVPSPTTSNKLGVHLLLTDGAHDWPSDIWRNHMEFARQAVGEWGYVTELVRLDDLDPNRWQVFMDLCAELRLTPIIRLATTQDPSGFGWTAPPTDPDGTYRAVAASYADFVASMRWPTERHYVIVGNEPNHGSEWGGRPNPAAYAQYLKDVANAIHAADPNSWVLNAGFDPFAPNTGSQPFSDGRYYMDEESFLDAMMAAQPDVFHHIDAWASHAYPLGPFREGPWRQEFRIDLVNDAANPQHVDPPQGIYNRGVNGYEWELFKLATYGITGLPVFITETGWRHQEGSISVSGKASNTLPSADTVARYLDLALLGNDGRYPDLPQSGWQPWLADHRVIAITPFALNGLPSIWGHSNWLKLDRDGMVLGVYAPFQNFATLAKGVEEP